MKYNRQVKKEHYTENYDSFERFISYFYQKEIVLKYFKNIPNKSKEILEIGVGNGFLSDYLKKQNLNIQTFDIDASLNPNYVGDLTKLGDIIDKKFEMIVCFETLEHIKFEDVPSVLDQMSTKTDNYLIISIPQVRLYFSLWLKISKIKPLDFLISLPFPMKHKFDGQHYWELGKKGYSIGKFEKILTNKFIVEDNFIAPLNPYHRVYVLRKK